MLSSRWPAAAIALALLPASCGGDDEPPPPELSAAAMLDRAFEQLPASGVAQIDLEAQVPQVSSQPVTVELEGAFVSGDGASIPSFDLEGEADAAGFGVEVELVSTGDDAYVVFFGENYRVGADRVAALNQRAPGVNPRSWFGATRHAGTEEVEGTDSYRIEAPLQSDRVGADLEGLGLGAVDLRGLEGGSIETWVGAEDGAIHRLHLVSEALELDLVLSDLGEQQRIEPPAGGGFQPIEDLLRRIPGL